MAVVAFFRINELPLRNQDDTSTFRNWAQTRVRSKLFLIFYVVDLKIIVRRLQGQDDVYLKGCTMEQLNCAKA